MSKDKHKLVIDNAIKWLASEFNYFKELEEDLNKLNNSLRFRNWKKGQAAEQIKEAMHDYLYASKSERRFERNLKLVKEFKFSEKYQLPADFFASLLQSNVNDLEAGLQKAQEDVKEIKHRLDIEGNHLVFAASYFRGDIRAKLFEIKDLITQDERIRQSKDEWEISDKEEEDLLKIEKDLKSKLDELLALMKTTDQWLSALTSDLKSAKKIFNLYQSKSEINSSLIRTNFGPQVESLNSSVKDVHPYKKALTNLSQFLNPKVKDGLPKSAFNEVKRLIGVTISRSKVLYNGGVRDVLLYAGQIYYDNGLRSEAKKVWSDGGDYLLKERNWNEGAADCYKKAELWNKAAKAYEENKGGGSLFDGSYYDAAECYSKTGIDGYRKIGMGLMRIAVKFGKSGYSSDVGHYFDNAASLFNKGRLFDLEGKCLEMKADLIVKQRKGDQYEYYDWSSAFHDYVLAFKAYKKAGNQAKLNELLPKIRYAEECNCRVRNNERNFFINHSTDGNVPRMAYPRFNPNNP